MEKEKVIEGEVFTLECENDWVYQYVSEKQNRATFGKINEGTFNWGLLDGDPNQLSEADKNSAAIMLYGIGDPRIPKRWAIFAIEHLEQKQEEALKGMTKEEIKEMYEYFEAIEENEKG